MVGWRRGQQRRPADLAGRGTNLDGDTVFFLDNARPPADNPDKAGVFYNKAPRFSIYGSNYYDCEPVK